MKALVLGGADCLWSDLDTLGPVDGLVVAVNDAGAHYPGKLDAWVSLHPAKFPAWKRQRRENGYDTDVVTWSQPGSHHGKRADRTLAGWKHGSSSFLAVGVAFELGASEVVLCGVPMQAKGAHFFDPKPWEQVNMYTAAWEKAAHHLRGRVTSMSGWTRELLGAPPSLDRAA